MQCIANWTAVEVKVEEEQSNDEMAHTNEMVGYLVHDE